MVVSVKDSFKLVAVSVVCFCAVFVCTFMLNFYFDVVPLKDSVPAESMALYDAQLATAKFTSAISGGFLAVIAVIMVLFYIKIYIDGHLKQLGILKAMGYSENRLSLCFWVFGLSAFLGCALGFACGWIYIPYAYDGLIVNGLTVEIHFHPSLLVCLVIAPSIIFSMISCLYAMFALKRPVGEMLKGERGQKIKKEKICHDKDRPFLIEMAFKTLSSKKMLAFFIAFSCFCFSAMFQMGLSMDNLVGDGSMGKMILVIGVVIAIVIMIIAVTSLINSNLKNISVMKAFGYSIKECSLALLLGYVPFAVAGFVVGTLYQYGLLSFMVNIIFKSVGEVPEYKFSVPIFFITLALFIVSYGFTMLISVLKFSKISVKEVMTE